MHPYIKLDIDENVPELAIIRGLVRAGFEVHVDGDTGTIRVKVGRAIDRGLPPAKVTYLGVYRAAICCK